MQIFATDLDEDAIARARTGQYPMSISTDVSADRLRRFFQRRENGYEVGPATARAGGLRHPRPHARLPVLASRPLQLPQRPDLPPGAAAEAGAADDALRAAGPTASWCSGPSETVGDSAGAVLGLRQEEPRLSKQNVASTGCSSCDGVMPRDVRSARGRPAAGPSPAGGQSAAARRSQGAGAVRSSRGAGQREPGRPAVPRPHRPVPRTAAGDRHAEPAPKLARPELHASCEPRSTVRSRRTCRPRPARRLTVGDEQRAATIEVHPLRDSATADAKPPGALPARGRNHASGRIAAAAGPRPARRQPRRGAGAGAGQHQGVPPVHHRGAGDLERGAEERQRGAPVLQRGAAEHQRGAGDLEGGAAEHQRGADHGQRRAPEPDGGAVGQQRRPGQPARGGGNAGGDGGDGSPAEAIHRVGREAVRALHRGPEPTGVHPPSVPARGGAGTGLPHGHRPPGSRRNNKYTPRTVALRAVGATLPDCGPRDRRGGAQRAAAGLRSRRAGPDRGPVHAAQPGPGTRSRLPGARGERCRAERAGVRKGDAARRLPVERLGQRRAGAPTAPGVARAYLARGRAVPGPRARPRPSRPRLAAAGQGPRRRARSCCSSSTGSTGRRSRESRRRRRAEEARRPRPAS